MSSEQDWYDIYWGLCMKLARKEILVRDFRDQMRTLGLVKSEVDPLVDAAIRWREAH